MFGAVTSELLDSIVALQKAIEAVRDVPLNQLPEEWINVVTANDVKRLLSRLTVTDLIGLPTPCTILLQRVSSLCELAPDWDKTCFQIQNDLNLLDQHFAIDQCTN